MNELKEREKEKKQKLKQLEAEIKEMKRDHKETFEVMSSPSSGHRNSPKKRVICAVIGALIVISAVLCLWFYPPVFNRYAVFRIGSLRFTRSVFFLPLAISLVALIIAKKRRKFMLFIAISAVIAVVGTTVTIRAEATAFPVWIYAVAYSGIFVGIGLLLYAAFLNKR